MGTNDEISDTTPLWWELQNIPTEVVRELRRRSNTNNIGMSIPTPFTNATFDFEKNYNKYKGPMTPWVRVFSNSTGKTINGMVPKSAYLNKNDKEKDYNGFLLKGGEGFFDAFGYEQGKPLNTKAAIIGYEADGTPHYIDNKYRSQTMIQTPLNADFPQNSQSSPIIPPPGLISVSVKQSKEHLTYASFKFKCYGIAQLEYLTPFFLTAGINVFIEFGWNLFNQQSLLDLNSLDECLKLVTHPQTALDRANKSNGNYGCISGLITKYSFTTTDGFVYDCNVDLTSRQALYAGMKIDNSPKILKGSIDDFKNSSDIKQFLGLRTFVKTNLPKINAVMRDKVNFMHYIETEKLKSDDDKNKKDEAAATQQLSIQSNYSMGMTARIPIPSTAVQPTASVPTISIATDINTTLFYAGKPEDRVFAGRSDSIYNAKKLPDGNPTVINYGNVTSRGTTYDQISFADEKTDFDAKDGSTEVWMQLDFVFELVNLFGSNLKTNLFKIDISDVIISAHPNLISCDKNVLIPNPVSPKINLGSPQNTLTKLGGFLKDKKGDPLQNPFLFQSPDMNVKINSDLEVKYNEAVKNNTLSTFYRELTTENSFYFAATAAMNTFKTSGRVRDNIDSVINYLYYNSKNNNLANEKSAAFPFATETTVSRKNKDGGTDNKKYKQYYYGYLKHLYISKTKLINIVENDNIKTYKQFINEILTTINESVDNFWKFDIVEGEDKENKSILSIIDKNASNFDELKSVYMFELGKTTNVVKGINFDVSLTNEQAIQVQFGVQNSDNLKETLLKKAEQNPTATMIEATNIPFLKFVDRMDKHQLQLLISETSESSVKTLVPGTTIGVINDKNAIADLQTYGSKEKNNILCITTKKFIAPPTPVINIPTDPNIPKLTDPRTTPKYYYGRVSSPTSYYVVESSFDNPYASDMDGGLMRTRMDFEMRKYKKEENRRRRVALNPADQRAARIAVAQADRADADRADADRKRLQLTKEKKLEDLMDDIITPKNHKFLCLSSDMKGKLTQMLNDNDYKNNVSKYSGVADNFNITIKFDGIFSFRNLQVFAISNLPNPYVPGNVIFQILEVDHEISSGKWETTVTALVRCIGGTKLEYIPV